MSWNYMNCTSLIKTLEDIAQGFDLHIGLTGGVLYKDSEVNRKDLDIIIYSVRQVEHAQVNFENFFKYLMQHGLVKFDNGIGIYQWLNKADYNGRRIDFFIPEAPKTSRDTYKEDGQDSFKDLAVAPI